MNFNLALIEKRIRRASIRKNDRATDEDFYNNAADIGSLHQNYEPLRFLSHDFNLYRVKMMPFTSDSYVLIKKCFKDSVKIDPIWSASW